MITYVDPDESLRERVRREWGEVAARHMHLDDGFSIVALAGNDLAGLIAVVWRDLPLSVAGAIEGYIDIIEVHADHRRRGLAASLVRMATARARERGAYQLRAWSSEDKDAAISMWRALGFGLCPATVTSHGRVVAGYFATLVV